MAREVKRKKETYLLTLQAANEFVVEARMKAYKKKKKLKIWFLKKKKKVNKAFGIKMNVDAIGN